MEISVIRRMFIWFIQRILRINLSKLGRDANMIEHEKYEHKHLPEVE